MILGREIGTKRCVSSTQNQINKLQTEKNEISTALILENNLIIASEVPAILKNTTDRVTFIVGPASGR